MTTLTETLNLVRGDDYLAADSRALAFASSDWPDLTSASIRFSVLDQQLGTRPISGVSGIIVSPTGSALVRIPLTSAQTFALVVGRNYLFDVVAILADASRVTLANGAMNVAQNASP